MKLVGISGISGSGKTHLLQKIKDELNENVSILSFDNYYKPIQFQQKDENGYENFDLPEGVDNEKFLADLETLKRGESVRIKRYQFNNPNAEETYIEIHPAPVLFVEGIFVFYFQSVFSQLDYKIFIEASAEITLQRRLERDVNERGLEETLILYQWEKHALPGFEKYIKAFKNQADLIVENESNTDEAYEHILKKLGSFII